MIKTLGKGKSSKEAWNYLERKYNNYLFSINEDWSMRAKVGISGCFVLIASHYETTTSKTTYRNDAVSNSGFSIQESYDQLF